MALTHYDLDLYYGGPEDQTKYYVPAAPPEGLNQPQFESTVNTSPYDNKSWFRYDPQGWQVAEDASSQDAAQASALQQQKLNAWMNAPKSYQPAPSFQTPQQSAWLNNFQRPAGLLGQAPQQNQTNYGSGLLGMNQRIEAGK